MAMQFAPASRKKAKLRLTLTGPSGSGKTLAALMIAKGLGGTIGVIDTERGSAELYAADVRLSDGSIWTPPPFSVLQLAPPYTPERFIEAIDAAEAAGFDNLIIDSTTHEWSGIGGCLEMVDQLAARKLKGNTWAAFAEITPRHRKFIDRLMNSPAHVITTMRAKTETAQEKRGDKTVVVKLGMKSEQRDGTEFEFTTVVDIQHGDHLATASKDRTGVFQGLPAPITEDTGRRLREWLETGEDAPEPPPPPPPVTEELLVQWTDELRNTRTEADLDATKERCIAACQAVSDRAAAGRVNAICKAHRTWLRATKTPTPPTQE